MILSKFSQILPCYSPCIQIVNLLLNKLFFLIFQIFDLIYRWESSTDGLRVEGSMLKIEHHMMDRQQHYTCYASNVVKDEQYTAQNDVTFYASKYNNDVTFHLGQ